MDTPAAPSIALETPHPTTALLAPPSTKLLAAPRAGVSDSTFEEVVEAALQGVGGKLLFKVRLGPEDDGQHVAAACVGGGPARQFLLLSMPVAGGQLKVETAARSASPLAGIAASYAGLMDVLKVAA